MKITIALDMDDGTEEQSHLYQFFNPTPNEFWFGVRKCMVYCLRKWAQARYGEGPEWRREAARWEKP